MLQIVIAWMKLLIRHLLNSATSVRVNKRIDTAGMIQKRIYKIEKIALFLSLSIATACEDAIEETVFPPETKRNVDVTFSVGFDVETDASGAIRKRRWPITLSKPAFSRRSPFRRYQAIRLPRCG